MAKRGRKAQNRYTVQVVDGTTVHKFHNKPGSPLEAAAQLREIAHIIETHIEYEKQEDDEA